MGVKDSRTQGAGSPAFVLHNMMQAFIIPGTCTDRIHNNMACLQNEAVQKRENFFSQDLHKVRITTVLTGDTDRHS